MHAHPAKHTMHMADSRRDAFTVYGKVPDGCAHVRLVAVPTTNAHLATVDYSCGQAGALLSAFCPCSVADTRCLLCARVDAQECECPCLCHGASTAAQVTHALNCVPC